MSFIGGDAGGAGTEDCLKINVYTPIGTKSGSKRELDLLTHHDLAFDRSLIPLQYLFLPTFMVEVRAFLPDRLSFE